jgi:transposase
LLTAYPGWHATIPECKIAKLYRRILGIEAPWQVDSVELKPEAGEAHVLLAHQHGMEWPCQECGVACKLHDHQPRRQWRHLGTCQYRTILHAAPPRSACSEHGVRVVKTGVGGALQPVHAAV